jgi:hypothetical protein
VVIFLKAQEYKNQFLKSENMRHFNVKSLASLLLIIVAGIVAYSILDAFAASNVILGVGAVVAGGTITQQSATGGETFVEATEYLDMKDVERKVELYKPYQTPLLTILSDKGKGDPVESWEPKYYAVDARGMKTTVTAATAVSGGAAAGVSTLTVADASIFTRNNMVFFKQLSGGTYVHTASGVYLVGIITGFPSTNQINVRFLNNAAGLTSTHLTSGTMYIYRLASAHNETTGSTTPWGILPETDYNFVQIFMEQVEESEYQKIMKKEADWGFADLKRMAIEDFKIQRERAFLGGYRSATNLTIDGQTKRVYTCGGLLNDTGIPVNSSFDLSDFVTTPNLIVPVLKSVFTGNNGSKERWMLLGGDFTEAVEKANFTDKQIMSKETQTIMGITCTKMVSTFGTLNLLYYEQLDLLGMAASALILDINNIYIKDLKGNGFNVRPIDYKTSGIAKVDASAIEQASTLLIKNKTTHLIINAAA